ncbi:hypothetical protein NDU88_009917 [Pleurodeles waltl]|uniref:Uncharacterized protein n=1 Tax=Pleurodeles waltl TaxID=8319 RepID=A0AAV7QSX8_PLEWA|nr:hypothetical protein NDU88_009917 [Pleurodeles waltl]
MECLACQEVLRMLGDVVPPQVPVWSALPNQRVLRCVSPEHLKAPGSAENAGGCSPAPGAGMEYLDQTAYPALRESRALKGARKCCECWGM